MVKRNTTHPPRLQQYFFEIGKNRHEPMADSGVLLICCGQEAETGIESLG